MKTKQQYFDQGYADAIAAAPDFACATAATSWQGKAYRAGWDAGRVYALQAATIRAARESLEQPAVRKSVRVHGRAFRTTSFYLDTPEGRAATNAFIEASGGTQGVILVDKGYTPSHIYTAAMDDKGEEMPTNSVYMHVNPHDAEATEFYLQRGPYGWRRTGRVTMPERMSADFIHMALHDMPIMTYGAGLTQLRHYHLRQVHPWTDPATNKEYCKYAIVYPHFTDDADILPGGILHNAYRVVNLWTGAESSLYTFQEAREIVKHALDGTLLGSFGLAPTPA